MTVGNPCWLTLLQRSSRLAAGALSYSPNGGALEQPRATPWEQKLALSHQAPTGRAGGVVRFPSLLDRWPHVARRARPVGAGERAGEPFSQGRALGCSSSARWASQRSLPRRDDFRTGLATTNSR